MNLSRYLAFILIAALLSGCTLFQPKAPPAPPAPPKPPAPAEIPVDRYYPAKAGSVWKYLGEGNEFAQFTRTVTFSSGNKSQVEDASGAVVASVVVITPTEVRRVAKSVEMDEKRNLLNEKETLSEVILKAPLKQGTTWKSGDSTHTIEATGQTVTVPAGTFKDVVKVKISQPNSTWVTVDSYAPNVGLILRDSNDGTYQVSSLLESYTPGK